METPKLTQRDKEAAPRILDGLRTSGIEVTEAEWRYVPQLQQWQYFVKTSWVEEHGEDVILRAQKDALINSGIEDEIASRVRLEREWRKA